MFFWQSFIAKRYRNGARSLEIAATTDLVSIIRTKLTVPIPRYYIIEGVAKKHHIRLNQSEVVFGQRLATEPC
jgi:hypothetical protein